jgi:hypothetical protein
MCRAKQKQETNKPRKVVPRSQIDELYKIYQSGTALPPIALEKSPQQQFEAKPL